MTVSKEFDTSAIINASFPDGNRQDKYAAPTPEVEPVAWIRGSGLELLRQKQHATVFPSEGCSNHSIALYTHPAPSELVKAATELIDAYNRALPFRPTNFHELMCNLDTALDKVKS